MKTVAQEMSAEQRCAALIKGLRASELAEGDSEVTVHFSHLAHALGMDVAENLVNNLVEMQSLVPKPFSRKQQMVRDGLCQVDRAQALEACERRHQQLSTQKAAENKAAIDRAIAERNNRMKLAGERNA